MSFEHIRYEVDGSIATVTLNRPEVLNAQTERMHSEIIQAADRWDADDGIRAVIFTGAGRAFSAGTDLSQSAITGAASSSSSTGSMRSDLYRDGGGVMTLRLFESRKPMIAAINGAAVGIGATMTLPMDMRIAAEGARFGFVFVRRGIVPESCSTWFLPRIVGIARALEWFDTGRLIPAAEALSHDLVSEVLPADQLLKRAREIAQDISDHAAPVSVAMSRQFAWRMLSADHPMVAHQLESRALTALRGSPDTIEGVRSFLEKRPPKFTMKVSSDLPPCYSEWGSRDK
jgi:enoyl-CoA hydratase/carnithine racemase